MPATRPLARLALLASLLLVPAVCAALPFTTLDASAPPAGSGAIILTFDDGPAAEGGVSAALLDVLAKHGVKAAFFFIGRNVAAHPELAHRAAQEGHQIGVHSWDSEWPQWFDTGALRAEIARTREAIERATGAPLASPLLYRPPRGIVTPAVDQLRDSCELRLGHLTFYARDSGAAGEDAARVMERTRSGLRKHGGGAVVFHSSRYRADVTEDNRVDKRWLPGAIDALITWAQAEGLSFQTYAAGGEDPCIARS